MIRLTIAFCSDRDFGFREAELADRKAQDWLSEYPEVVEKIGRGLDKHTPEPTRNTSIVCSATSGQLCLLYSVIPIGASTEQHGAEKAKARTNGAVAIFQPKASSEAAEV